jgi:hypothetical protein
VQQATELEFIINLKAAKALGSRSRYSAVPTKWSNSIFAVRQLAAAK